MPFPPMRNNDNDNAMTDLILDLGFGYSNFLGLISEYVLPFNVIHTNRIYWMYVPRYKHTMYGLSKVNLGQMIVNKSDEE